MKHVGKRPDQDKQGLIIDQALRNLRVPKAAYKLMKLYASHADGFRPSLKLIHETTGIDTHNVSRCRMLLVQYGLIAYDGKCITIDWVRLSAFASMDTSKMGQKNRWSISPIKVDLPDESKNDVHNYIGTGDFESRRLYALYEATRQAIEDGVKFPELKDISNSNLLDATKNDVHNYIGMSDFTPSQQGLHESVGWYNPFDEPDPPWVYQDGSINAYQEVAP